MPVVIARDRLAPATTCLLELLLDRSSCCSSCCS